MAIINCVSRTDFTYKEQKHLVEYIAKLRPGGDGRLGNTPYKNLVELVRLMSRRFQIFPSDNRYSREDNTQTSHGPIHMGGKRGEINSSVGE